MKNLIRAGQVSSVNPVRCTARVTFLDRDNLVSAELPVLQPCAAGNQFYSLPDVGNSVLCLMLPNDDCGGAGFILGSLYSDEKKTPTDNQDVSMIRFEDGTTLSYDRNKHELNIKCVGDIKINGRNIYLND